MDSATTNLRAESANHTKTRGTDHGKDALAQAGTSPPAVDLTALPPIAATLYAAYKTVFPIAFPAKHPPGWFGRWQWVNESPPEPYQLRFYSTMPHDGWGVATGSTSGIVVLDADVKDGKQGLQTMKALDFAAPHVRTAGGGGHYYFKHPGRYVATRTNVLRDVDVRGDGGLVVFDGPGYQFVGDPLELHEWDTLPLDVRLLLESESRVGDLSINPQGLSVPPEIQGHVLFPIDSDAERLVPTWAEYAEADGSRDGAAFSLALTLLQKDYAPEGVLELLLSEFLPRMPDKGPRNTFTAADVRKCVQSAWRIRVNDIAAEGRDSKEETGENADGEGSSDTPPDEGDRASNAVYSIKPVENVPITWLVDALVPEKAITVFSGDSGSGKSWFCLALADAVANRETFLNSKVTNQPVLYIDGENPQSVVSKRFDKLNITDRSSVPYLGGWEKNPKLKSPGPDNSEIRAWIELEAEAGKAPLVIYDTWATFYRGKPSDEEINKHYQLFKALVAAGATIVIQLHSSEKTPADYRGLTALKDGLDMAYKIESDAGDGHPLSKMNIKPWKERVAPGRRWRLDFEDGKGFSGKVVNSGKELHSFGKRSEYSVTEDAEEIVKALKSAKGDSKSPARNDTWLKSQTALSPTRYDAAIRLLESEGRVCTFKGDRNANMRILPEPDIPCPEAA